MESLIYHPQISSEYWAGEVIINFEAEYNPMTNQTTVKFAESSHEYFGRLNYWSWAETVITVTANDNPSSAQTATFRTEGDTNGGMELWRGTPSPSSVVVQHAFGSGEKSITIAGSTTIYCAVTSSAVIQESFTREGSIVVTPDDVDIFGFVRIGTIAGIPYVGKDGQWHRGVAYAGDGGEWKHGC